MTSFVFWFVFAIIVLICVVVPIAVTQIAQIGHIIGRDGNEEE